MPSPIAEWSLATHHLGRRVLVFDRLASTNSHAAELAADPRHDGLVILAKQQSAGRGQHGRSWRTPAGEAVLLSVLLFPTPPLRRPVLLAAWAAVAVCETIRRVAAQPAQIKWPNDVLIQGKKVCGILIEQGRGTVAGIGLNVRQSSESFAAAGLPQAAALAHFTPNELDVEQVARTLIEQLDVEFARLHSGDLMSLESAWREHSGLVGRPVRIECHDADHVGRLLDMSWEAVLLETDGGVHAFRPEAIRHVTALDEESPGQ